MVKSRRAARHGHRHAHAARRLLVGALRVPEITAYFWIVKGLSTAMGEATSDYLVHAMNPVVAVLIGFAAFLIAMTVQLCMRRYLAWTYWLAVVMVGVFGTMAADVLHVRFGVPYVLSSGLYGAILAVVFLLWSATERTLSIHAIDSTRREVFYWLVVCATFAMGTAVGDMSAVTLHLGYFRSIGLFAVLITVPVIGFRWFRWSETLSFWFAYVVTRPLGASVADFLGKPRSVGGLAMGDGHVSLVLAALITLLVGFLAATRLDVQRSGAAPPATASR